MPTSIIDDGILVCVGVLQVTGMEPDQGAFMSCALVANFVSLFFGVLSAFFWVKAAIAKAPPPAGFEGVKNTNSWKATIVDGGELYGTLRLQSRWNSRAAFAAAATVFFQVIATTMNMIPI